MKKYLKTFDILKNNWKMARVFGSSRLLAIFGDAVFGVCISHWCGCMLNRLTFTLYFNCSILCSGKQYNPEKIFFWINVKIIVSFWASIGGSVPFKAVYEIQIQ